MLHCCRHQTDLAQTLHNFAKQQSAESRLPVSWLALQNCTCAFSLKIRESCFQGCIFYSFTSHKYRGCGISLYRILVPTFAHSACLGISWWRGGGSLQHKQVGKLGIQKQWLQNRGSISNLARCYRTEEALKFSWAL